MAFRLFTVPIQDSGAAEAELNAFLRSHTVLSIEKRWVDQGTTSFWSFCIDYLDPLVQGGRGSSRVGQRQKVDYREILDQEEFAVFAKLREVRKAIAQAEGVPVYTIFNNEQLAQMARKKVRTKSDLEAIVGVGDSRIEKYGPRFLERLSEQTKASDEKDG